MKKLSNMIIMTKTERYCLQKYCFNSSYIESSINPAVKKDRQQISAMSSEKRIIPESCQDEGTNSTKGV